MTNCITFSRHETNENERKKSTVQLQKQFLQHPSPLRNKFCKIQFIRNLSSTTFLFNINFLHKVHGPPIAKNRKIDNWYITSKCLVAIKLNFGNNWCIGMSNCNVYNSNIIWFQILFHQLEKLYVIIVFEFFYSK